MSNDPNSSFSADPTVSGAPVICILTPLESNRKIIEEAARQAAALGVPLTGVYIQTPHFDQIPEDQVKSLKRNILYIKENGGRVEVIEGWNAAFLISEFIKSRGASLMVIGKNGTGERHLLERPLTSILQQSLPDQAILVMPEPPVPYTSRLGHASLSESKHSMLQDALRTGVLLVLATLVCFAFYHFGFDEAVLPPVYILSVVLTAIFTESWTWSILSAVVSIFLFDFLFAMPRFSLVYMRGEFTMVFLVTFITSILAGLVASNLRKQSLQVTKSSWRSQTLLETTHRLQDLEDPDEIPAALCRQIAQTFKKDVLYYHWMDNTMVGPECFPADPNTPVDLENAALIQEAALAAILHTGITGASTRQYRDCKYQFIPLRTPDAVYGVIGLRIRTMLFDSSESAIVRSMITEGALSIENKRREKAIHTIRLQNQSSLLRSNMLKAISHDLRTPLTAIIGNTTSMKMNAGHMPAEEEVSLAMRIYNDSLTLYSMVENLLCAAKLDNGIMPVNLHPEMVEDLIDESIRITQPRAGSHPMEVIKSQDLLMIDADSSLLSQAVVNLILNAIQHTPNGTPIQIRSFESDGKAVIEVADLGSGISAENKPHIFDMFYTGNRKILDSASSLGLGLYLAKTITEAHHGEISLRDNAPRGSVFSIAIPLTVLNE